MATVMFYEKPGCINNTKQKALLMAAGHELQVHNLLTEAWTIERLRAFFGDLPIAACFNPTAPQVKSGEIDPSQIDTETALELMIRDPILIRRPLMQVGDRFQVGFGQDQVDEWIGLQPVNDQINRSQRSSYQELRTADLQTCPQSQR